MRFREKTSFCFDLDGTLIDSAPSIMKAFEEALSMNSLPLRHEISIGPTLEELIRLQGITEIDRISDVKQSFLSAYDQDLCISARLYPGVKDLLQKLSNLHHRLTLVTNKRISPTMKILEHHEISQLFTHIVGSDSNHLSKSGSLKLLRSDDSRNLYIGDTNEDAIAAEQAGYNFVHANWGYGTYSGDNKVENVFELTMFLNESED